MELRETAKNMLTSSLAAKPGETLLVITDDSRVKIGTAIYEAGKELGIGTNKAAILNGIILEDEKVYGTVHIAFGTNTSFGGTNKADCHMDGIILKPTLYLDGRKIIDHGEFLV